MNTRVNGIGMTSPRTRNRMVERLRAQGIGDEIVLAAMTAVPRHLFVEEAMSHLAYDDKSLPIGHGQTISQPYIVARMIEVLRNGKSLNRVLEIGTGRGYQAAVLGQVAREVYTVERIEPLHQLAVKNLREIGASNVKASYADGGMGLPARAPFDAIIMAAASTYVPPDLLAQLAVGGRMVLPMGTQDQVLCLIERTEQGIKQTVLEAANFVPFLLGTAGAKQ